MGLADQFERRLEQIVEGFFSRAFRSKLQAAEIGRRLLREMEAGKTVSVGAVYVPNRYEVGLSHPDHARFEGLESTLRQEFEKMLKEAARDRKWKLPGTLAVHFQPVEGLKEGKFSVEAVHDSEALPTTDAPSAFLRLKSDAGVSWPLAEEKVVVGRDEGCDVYIPSDNNASRRHAELELREDGWWIQDLGSLNNTFVNETVVKERRLQPGDVIRVGVTDLEFVQEEEQSSSA